MSFVVTFSDDKRFRWLRNSLDVDALFIAVKFLALLLIKMQNTCRG